jgi:hypothetical protein
MKVRGLSKKADTCVVQVTILSNISYSSVMPGLDSPTSI